MNMLEALRAISAHNAEWKWARPVRWRSLGQAICYGPNGFEHVPGPRGGTPAYLPSRVDVLGKWEVVEPREVNEGR